MQSIENHERPFEFETLSEIDQLNEYIMTKLRLEEGMYKQEIESRWGNQLMSTISMHLERHIQNGKVEKTESGWKLTNSGKFFADGIAADLFQV